MDKLSSQQALKVKYF